MFINVYKNLTVKSKGLVEQPRDYRTKHPWRFVFLAYILTTVKGKNFKNISHIFTDWDY